MIYGGIEGGGTKWVCAVGNGPDDLQAIVTVPTTTPVETIDRVAAFFALLQAGLPYTHSEMAIILDEYPNDAPYRYRDKDHARKLVVAGQIVPIK